MKFIIALIISIILLIQICFGKLLPCSQIMQKVCYISEDYKDEINPEPLPTKINITLKIFEVTDVNEKHQTLTMSMRAVVEWQDHRLDVNRSKDYIERDIEWYLIEELDDVWVPEIFIGNSVRSLDLIKYDHMWYYSPRQMVKYTMILTPKISCNLDFHTFPFDSHECVLDLKNWIGASYRVMFNSIRIFTNDKNGTEISGDTIEVNADERYEYNFVFKTMPASVFKDYDIKYAMAQVGINFKRSKRNRNKIFGGYHVTTGTFALLSLISFSIERDVVPGRMGMLIIIYLMQINTYNSVQAPPNRGFSMIETWFVGIQIPILFAILQYGIILTLKKYWPDQKRIKPNTIDLWTFFFSVSYLIVFNLLYWFA